MKLTNHSVQRMKQRNINQDMIMLANIFGEPSKKGEKTVLKEKILIGLLRY